MDNVPPLFSLFGGSRDPTSQAPTHNTDDTALSPSNPQLSLQGVGTYNHSVGIPLAIVQRHWANSNAATKEHPFWANDINPEKTDSGDFTRDDRTHVTWRVENQRRHMHTRKKGPEGTTCAGLDDELLPDGKMITNCYLVPPTKEGEVQNVGVRWEGAYIPNVDLPYSLYEPHKINLIVPSAALDPYFDRPPSSTKNADGSLNFQKLMIKKPLLSRLGAKPNEAPETFISDWFKGSREKRVVGIPTISNVSEPSFPSD